ncbi:unnamed protein product [Strongylus vulgaris]|uniref:oleoyl-[acyl-carrier-protein] hydrolase n=1 Tax=Strongylus vulgaris TaxID=40348 RepID=A0A3P7IMQ8_STRVU|nr:unnamed protein product [Strongylus vulgaris]
MIYAEAPKSDSDIHLGETVAVIGGGGAIGSTYVEMLRKITGVTNVVILSRKYGNLNTIIHAAGEATTKSLEKTVPDMLKVLLPKVAGLTNILDYLKNNKLKLENLIMASSLSSIVALQGTDDYAAANIFMDALALNGDPHVNRILSVQWPAWKSAGMAATFGHNELHSMLMRTAISPQIARQAVRETLGFAGVVAHSLISPLEMRELIEKAQLTGERVKVSENSSKKNESLKEKVACIWREVLGVEVQNDTDFFDNGGNSLSALRVVWTLNTMLKIDITVATLFKYPLFQDFVSILPCQTSPVKVDPFDRTLPAELTYSQENMFLLRHLEKGPQYNILFAIYFRKTTKKFSKETLTHSIHSLIARQHSLRTCFCQKTETSTSYQTVLSLTESYQNLSCIDVKPLDHEQIIEEERNYEFNLEKVPLRVRLNQINNDYVVLFNQHHILTDGWSITVLAQELNSIYTMYWRSKKERVQPIPYSVCEYAQWQRKNLDFSKELEELKSQLLGREATALPQKSVGEKSRDFKKLVQILPDPLAHCLSKMAKTYHTTEFVIALSAFVFTLRKLKANSQDDSIVLKANSQDDSIVVGCPVLGRSEKVKDLIGYFLNNIVVSLDVRLDDSLENVILSVKKATADTRRFEHVPFHKLVAKLNPKRQLNEHPVFQIFFNYRHELDFPRVEIPNAKVKINQLSMNKIFNLSISFDETSNGTRIMMEYNSSKYYVETIRLLMKNMLRNFIMRDNLQDIQTQNRVDYPICVSSGDDVVALEMDTGDAPEVILAMHQIGVGYAPIDPTWPKLRKAQILERTPVILNVSKDTLTHISQKSSKRKRFKFNRISADDIAYIIHTSGSTGPPKGVVLSHKNLSSFLRGATRQTLMRPGYRISNSVNIVFDVSVMNIFASCVNACELCIHDNVRYAPFEVKELQCDFAFFTSATFNALTIEDLQRMTSLEKLFVGGESVNDRILSKALELGIDVTQIYGPTEDTVWSLTNRCKLLKNEGSLIGTPMLNETCSTKANVYEGELVLEGSKIARGYINDPENKQFYIENGKRCYSTGDIVKYERYGFTFKGRIDDQIKIRGHRIEAKEVERAILVSSPEVSEAYKLIDVKEVNENDSFFSLGGHSLLLFDLKKRIFDKFKVTIDVHELFANVTIADLAKLITTKRQMRNFDVDTSIIIKLRETSQGKLNAYFIHAIGGSIFPYHAFLHLLPKEINIYAIEYKLHFTATSLKELAAFYAKAVSAHTKNIPAFLMGHSLGGLLSREMVEEMKLWGKEVPFVVMFDTWYIQPETLNIEKVMAFAELRPDSVNVSVDYRKWYGSLL